MRYLLLSDIHSNDEALSAVLARARRRRFDRVVILGDFVGYGADPNAVLDRLRRVRKEKIWIRGNHDKVVAGLDSGDLFNPVALEAALWTRDNLTPENRKFLESLPRGPLAVEGGFAICHGSPRDEDAYIFSDRDALVNFRTFESASSATATSPRSSRWSRTASASRSSRGTASAGSCKATGAISSIRARSASRGTGTRPPLLPSTTRAGAKCNSSGWPTMSKARARRSTRPACRGCWATGSWSAPEHIIAALFSPPEWRRTEMREKRWRFVWLAFLLAPLARCGGGAGPAPAPVRPEVSPAPVAPPPRLTSPAEAQAALLELEDRRAYDEAILSAAARSSDAPTRIHAALADGRVADPRGERILRLLLSDSAPEVRAAAAFACQLTGDWLLTSDLIPLLADREAAVSAAAAAAIGFLGRADGQDALVAAIAGAAAPEPRASILRSLWRFSNPATEEATLRFAADPDPKVRSAALYALSRKPQAGSLSALTAALAGLGRGCRRDGGAGARPSRQEGVAGASRRGARERQDAPHGQFARRPGGHSGKGAGRAAFAERSARVLALAGEANSSLAVPAIVLLRQFAGVDREISRRLWTLALTGEGRRRQVALLSVVAVLKERAGAALDRAVDAAEAPMRAAAAESLVFLPPAQGKLYRERLAADKDARVRIAALSSLKTAEAVKDSRPLVNSAADGLRLGRPGRGDRGPRTVERFPQALKDAPAGQQPGAGEGVVGGEAGELEPWSSSTASTLESSGRFRSPWSCKLYGGSANTRSTEAAGSFAISATQSPTRMRDGDSLKLTRGA